MTSSVPFRISEATVLARECLELRPRDNPHHAMSLNNLANHLSTRYDKLAVIQNSSTVHDPTSPSDQEEVFFLYTQLAHISHSVSRRDLVTFRAWAHAAEKFNHLSMLQAYETSLRLLVEHLHLLPSLPQHLDIFMNEKLSLAVDAFSACLRNNAPMRTVELLEQGRGVFWNQLARLHPIVGFLQAIRSSHSRIWWCPTAEFSNLPLHAAGPYRRGQKNFGDLYISSYTPALGALIRARRPRPLTSANDTKHFVAIGQANAAGQKTLLCWFGTSEDSPEHQRCCLIHIPLVSEHLGKSKWTHIACHGLVDRCKPFKSAFALSDGHFTIEQIIRCDLEDPEFAYLSACHTTVGCEESPDEAIHLASAMQFIRSVIETMWGVDDSQTNEITSTFYKHMLDEDGCLDYTRAALALDRTMKSVRVRLDQRILYIHFGA